MSLIERNRTIALAQARTITHYRDFKEPLRRDFHHSCAYCGVWESQANGSSNFAVEHFMPKSIAPDRICDPTNLLYACMPCNRRKGRMQPYDADGRGWRILDPCSDDFDDHFREHEDAMLESEAASGKGMIEKFRLNDPSVLMQRKLRNNVKQAIIQVHRYRKICSEPDPEATLEWTEEINSFVDNLSGIVKALLPRRMTQ